MTLYTVLSNDRGHIYIVVVLQSCTDSLHILPSCSTEAFPTSSDCTHVVGNTDVEDDVYIVEESFMAVSNEADIAIKQEQTPQDISFPDIKAEPDKVSYVCVCRDILPVCSFFVSKFVAD